jgi:hypothetical protein
VRFHEAGAGARPHVEIDDQLCVLHARIRRCFPLTIADEYVSVCDGEGTEVGIIRQLQKLDERSRVIAANELDSFYFTPSIQSIKSLKQEASMWKWTVTTQRGDATFYLRGVRDSVHEVAPNRWQIYSVDGQRYEIRELNELDNRSQSLFESLF